MKEYQEVSEETSDIHSLAQPKRAKMTHLALDLKVDFDRKQLVGTATIYFDNETGANQLILDTKDLDIQQVLLDDSTKANYSLGEEVALLGRPLRIQVAPNTKKVTIAYTSSPKSAALQWLTPAQTAGGEQPFLFSQSQCILARTWIPCQDGPGMRFTYQARVEVPPHLMALMSAENPTEKNETGIYEFEMKQPIPAYLLALAVGDLAFQKIDERTGVYAEPATLEAAVQEFEEVGKMVEVAENLYGKYAWERYDILVLPPSFPFGGMENPRLTFATPTIIAGDKSLMSLVAHELAHSWSGNLVTNQTWNDFWLNEGFTVYFERRIVEALYGRDFAEMEALLGYQDLLETIEQKGKNNKDTKLLLDLRKRDPDEAVSDIAYEKGYFFLRLIEESIGREKFDRFLRKYFETFAFESMNTQRFINYLEKEIIKDDEVLAKKINYKDWIYGTGLPQNCPKVTSKRFTQVDAQLQLWKETQSTDSLNTADWSTQEWLHFIRQLPVQMDIEQMKQLDEAYEFTASGNTEIQAAWYVHAIEHQYEAAYEAIENFLINIGRRKFMPPMYSALVKTEEVRTLAKDIYAKARPNYHYVAVNTLDEIVGYQSAK
ncbi:MAG: M1 family metallopeptidase [Thermonemataceae bacterium]